MSKIEYISNMTEELLFKEVHMCISCVDKVILNALRNVDKTEMTKLSKIDAKMSILLSRSVISGLWVKIEKGELAGVTDINFTIDQEFNFFEEIGQSA